MTSTNSDPYFFVEEPNENWSGLVLAIAAFFLGLFFLYYLSAHVVFMVAYGAAFVGLFAGRSIRSSIYILVFRLFLPLTIALALLSLYFWGYSQTWFVEAVDSSKFRIRYLELLFQVLSSLYAICTAFLLWKGLTDHDHLRQILRDEANQIQRIVSYLKYFDDTEAGENKTTIHKVRRLLFDYVRNITVNNRISVSNDNQAVLRDLIQAIQNLTVEDENDQIALTEIMKGVSDLVMIRSKRVSQMEIKMSPYLLSSLVIMSLAIIYPFYTEGPLTASGELDYVNAICIFTLGGILSFLQMTLMDISSPFSGYWKIKVDSFRAILVELRDDSLAAVEAGEMLPENA